MTSVPLPTRLCAAVTGCATLLAAAAAPAVNAGVRTAPSARSGLITPGTPASCATSPALPKHEMRGLWIASVTNMDWPSRPGLSAAASQAELRSLLDLARRNGYNAVMLQVRPSADTFWPSTLEPWSQYLTGTQGGNPGWDPMAFAVREAHARGLELHAWVNPFRVALDTAGKALAPNHPARLHPEWTVAYGGRLYFNPGIPAVRDHVVAVITELVKRYDIDAIHFDDYFYPYPVDGQRFNDATTYATYGAGRSLADWRRQNITSLITAVRAAVHGTRPGTQFGVSPFGVWRNSSTDPAGSRTTAGVQTYDDLYADTRAWSQQGLVDYTVPQDYWSRTFAAASYGSVASWWADVAAHSPRSNLYLGEATYKVAADDDPAWNAPRELVSHLAVTDTLNAAHPDQLARGGMVKGHVYFDAAAVRQDALGATGIVSRERYAKPALTPTMPWLDATAPAAPQVARSGATLRITGPADANQYVVYRVPKHAANVTSCDLADTRNVAAIIGAGTRTWTDPQVTSGYGRYTWLVTSVDRGSNESAARLVR